VFTSDDDKACCEVHNSAIPVADPGKDKQHSLTGPAYYCEYCTYTAPAELLLFFIVCRGGEEYVGTLFLNGSRCD
jgi:hypothetical protein